MAAVGQFVRVVSNRLGIGKVARATEGEIEVEYFDSVAVTGRERVIARPADIERVQVSLQRRCYWLDGDGWRVVVELQRNVRRLSVVLHGDVLIKSLASGNRAQEVAVRA